VELLLQDILHCFVGLHRLPHDERVRKDERAGKGMEIWDVVPRRSCGIGDASQRHLSERPSTTRRSGCLFVAS